MQTHRKPINLLSNLFKDETVLCVASGPSIDTDDIEYAKHRCRTIVINDNYQLAPWADVLYACDLKWWDWHNGCPDFIGMKFTQDRTAAQKYRLNYIKGVPLPGLSDSFDELHTGSNSGYQAINLAHLLGAKRILLTGYDMKFSSNGASHWFGDHPDGVRSCYERFIKCFETIDQERVEIINCTRDTDLTCFPQMTLQEALQ